MFKSCLNKSLPQIYLFILIVGYPDRIDPTNSCSDLLAFLMNSGVEPSLPDKRDG